MVHYQVQTKIYLKVAVNSGSLPSSSLTPTTIS